MWKNNEIKGKMPLIGAEKSEYVWWVSFQTEKLVGNGLRNTLGPLESQRYAKTYSAPT